MKVFKTVKSFLKWRSLQKGKSIGLIPTMGALHEGHLSLVKKAKRENKLVVTTIFVNPTQFGPNEDFSKYPRTLDADLKLLKKINCDAVLAPSSTKEFYPRELGFKVIVPTDLSSVLEGVIRPGHFDGVATIVLKLLNIARADKAYFGEKDFQQLRVLEEMKNDLFISTKIVRCKTVREKSGLAMSSRNRYLSEKERQGAAILSHVIKTAKSAESARLLLEQAGYKVDYVKALNESFSGSGSRWLAAIRIGNVRLIDNVKR